MSQVEQQGPNAAFNIIRPELQGWYNGQLTVGDLRKYEKLSYKVEKKNLDLTFLRNCQSFNVTPKFLCFNLPHTNFNDGRLIRKRLLKSAIHKGEKERIKLGKDYVNHGQSLSDTLNSIDFYVLRKAAEKSVEKSIRKYIFTHEKKLRSLTKNVAQPFTADEIVTNLSPYNLLDDESEILKNGLSFAIPPSILRETDVFVSLEMIYRFMFSNLKDKNDDNLLKSSLSHIANSYYHDYRPSGEVIKKHGILKKLKKNNIVILKPDKGNGVVILDRKDYEKGILDIILDTTKFKKLDKNPTLKREGQLQRFLRNLKKKGFFSDKVYNDIYPSGSQSARIYGLPKMHKSLENLPKFRPIISSIGTCNYQLAKFLGGLLSAVIPKDYCTADTFTFVEELKKVDGVAMGSPLAPVLANLFMGVREKEWIKNYSGCGPTYYRRYVDDIFALFNDESEALAFFEYLNQRHPNIKFTLEKQVDGRLPYLDILIENTSDKFYTSVFHKFHKSTYTGLLTNYFSFTPKIYKIGLIKTLIDRTFKIYNSWKHFDINIKAPTEILRKNFFPTKLVNRHISNYLDKNFSTAVSTETTNVLEKRYFKLPFIGKYSNTAKEKVNQLVNKMCKEINVCLVFKLCKIKDYFSCNDLQSKLVYKFVCASCNASYVGETTRHISSRVKEHLNTEKNLQIFKHMQSNLNCKLLCNENCFSILDYADTDWQRKLKEEKRRSIKTGIFEEKAKKDLTMSEALPKYYALFNGIQKLIPRPRKFSKHIEI
ncbi:uncharacterized protein LOC130628959 [Hydractinia symbiolongicarpus]|uniref:uncharacterized protein LOC130628959 n=1 Tax=Hydractinia symbiolongicarpus TaxID=13093 RepID=UPI00254DD617|nr:uncharacterized protein LOC130628959 [Hydractinia symbiolongicarpus]